MLRTHSALTDVRATDTVDPATFAPIDILDYIYAVLHSPTYREKYKEFLKIDFPRVPYPKDAETFWQLVAFGGELRQIHLLESPAVNRFITQYPGAGDNVVEKLKYVEQTSVSVASPPGTQAPPPASGRQDADERGEHSGFATSDTVTLEEPALQAGSPAFQSGRVYINDTQYFDGVPETAWNFDIGGYQPAQKWLKDRKGRTLTYDDIRHYQKIIVALTETDRLMNVIDRINIDAWTIKDD